MTTSLAILFGASASASGSAAEHHEHFVSGIIILLERPIKWGIHIEMAACRAS
jgi:hypothetical protein